MDIKKEFYNKLPSDKIKINWNKNPVKMELFLSFIDVKVDRVLDHLGSDTGWTLLENKELNLEIGGGIISEQEYLDSLRFGEKLSNPYNNFVNPFFLWDILSSDGKNFFVTYYKDDISKITDNMSEKINIVTNELKSLSYIYKVVLKEVDFLIGGDSTIFQPDERKE